MNTRDVLWTGGWDSTFRILSLLAEGEDFIQPHYILNPERLSYSLELQAIERISSLAVARWGERLRPLLQTNLADIPVTDLARDRHAVLVKRFAIGPQYLWLSEYARSMVAQPVELCIHVDDKAYSVLKSLKDEPLGPDSPDGGDARRLIADHFTFPILEVSKVDMLHAARRDGYEDLMNLTWFCQIPTPSKTPCGFCNPCEWTVDEGLKYRVPLDRRIRLALYRNFVAKLPGWRLRQSLLALLRSAR
ncbi:hypothetical protein [Ectothiorhodospira variabilis]|uniref:hypothetical protein n=1 Tax=Ectothiorhodospira variabilis TaxID=505694 RepID=UPI001EFBBD18|nr:hypothetical protein [Ectothiorhodospira variabilis]MCG5494756.1 hypothetical protein [Ectothiorhodospira variabilis]MCG5504355.1 hypothetical protein [Ectothiorhodospira variabilis]MCG5507510.1 hypothetical protein [Ectothiorhodospira variabilis]